MSGNIIIVAKLTFKFITFIVNFTYRPNYDIATYSVNINPSSVGNSVTPKHLSCAV